MGAAEDQFEIGAQRADLVSDFEDTRQLRRGNRNADGVILMFRNRVTDHVEKIGDPGQIQYIDKVARLSRTAAIFSTPRLGKTRSSSRNSDGGMTRQTFRLSVSFRIQGA